jgi:hypothetical protein
MRNPWCVELCRYLLDREPCTRNTVRETDFIVTSRETATLRATGVGESESPGKAGTVRWGIVMGN